jgi:flavin-dependent dehydrogenase
MAPAGVVERLQGDRRRGLDFARLCATSAGSDRHHDVCVLGAGPAGLAVASRLTEKGRDVLVLDRTTRRAPWRGETLTGAVQGPLVEAGCWERFERAGHLRGHARQTAWGSEPRLESAVFDANGPLWHVDRDRFDVDLRATACERGAVLESYRKLVTVHQEAGMWHLALDHGREVRARYLVDATGRLRILGRRLGARIESHDRLMGLAAKVDADQAPTEIRTMLLQAAPFGWWYATPIPQGHVLVLFTDADLAPLELRRRLRPVAANSVFTDTEGAEGWLAVGDACASHDPLCGWGVHRALTNGLMAGEAIASLLATGSSTSVSAYRAHCREQYGRYLRGLHDRYSLEYRWPAAPFWARRHRPTSP